MPLSGALNAARKQAAKQTAAAFGATVNQNLATY